MIEIEGPECDEKFGITGEPFKTITCPKCGLEGFVQMDIEWDKVK